MRRKKLEFKSSIRVSFVIEEKYYEHLQKTALSLSSKEGRVVSQSELMRFALKQAFPLPENSDLENAEIK